MKKRTLFYGLCGEGLGHMTRTLAVVDKLQDFDVHLFTYGKAYNYLKIEQYPFLHHIDGVMFPYRNGKVDYLRLAWRAFKFYNSSVITNVAYIKRAAERHFPSLFISDFEPSIARAAKKNSMRLISVDNQHRFAFSDLYQLPLGLRTYGWFCGLAAKFIVPSPDKIVISTFHHDIINPTSPNVVITGGLIRESLEALKPVDGDFLLVYLRASIAEKVLDELEFFKFKIVVYGASKEHQNSYTNPNLIFKDLGPSFITDLANCKAILATAGNQLVSEARFFNKPCLLIPEPKQYEQAINGFYATKLKLGQSLDISQVSLQIIQDFTRYFKPTASLTTNGATLVSEIIRDYADKEPLHF